MSQTHTNLLTLSKLEEEQQLRDPWPIQPYVCSDYWYKISLPYREHFLRTNPCWMEDETLCDYCSGYTNEAWMQYIKHRYSGPPPSAPTARSQKRFRGPYPEDRLPNAPVRFVKGHNLISNVIPTDPTPSPGVLRAPIRELNMRLRAMRLEARQVETQTKGKK